MWTPHGGSFPENALLAAHDFRPVGRRGHIARLASMEPNILWPERRGAVANLS